MRARLDLRIDAELRTWLVTQSVAEARTITHIVERALCNERHAALATGNTGPAPPRTPRPARDATSPEPIAAAPANTERRLSKQELDMQRQQKLNAKKGATKR